MRIVKARKKIETDRQNLHLLIARVKRRSVFGQNLYNRVVDNRRLIGVSPNFNFFCAFREKKWVTFFFKAQHKKEK